MRALLGIPIALFVSALWVGYSSATQPQDQQGSSPLAVSGPTVFVVTEGGADAFTSTTLAIAMAEELNKRTSAAAFIPETSWTLKDIQAECAANNKGPSNAVGAFLITFSSGETDRFWVLFGEQTTVIYPLVQIVSCSPGTSNAILAKSVWELDNSHGTTWVDAHSELGIPLISYAGIASVFTKSVSSSKNDNTNLAIVAAAALSNVGAYTIPGWSPVRRARLASKKVADDFIGTFSNACAAASSTDSVAYFCGRVAAPWPSPTP